MAFMLRTFLLNCALIVVFANLGQGSTPFFRKDYEFNADTQNFYNIHTVGRSWQEAKARCQLEGASLFVPDSKQDVDTLVALMQTKLPSYEWVWVGVHDLFSEGEFITVDGVSFNDIYHEWGQGEPNNKNDMEDCVILRKNGKFNDDNCPHRYPFVCKKSRATVEWNVLCDMPDPSYLYNRDLGKCYKLHLQPKNWTDAYAICAAEQSYLAIINSKAESDHFVKLVADAPKDTIKGYYLSGVVHIGFHNQFNEGYSTIQGVKIENAGYSVWGRGQPDNSGGKEVCGTMFHDGTLNDINCDWACIFMCEHDIGQLSSSLDERIRGNEA